MLWSLSSVLSSALVTMSAGRSVSPSTNAMMLQETFLKREIISASGTEREYISQCASHCHIKYSGRKVTSVLPILRHFQNLVSEIARIS